MATPDRATLLRGPAYATHDSATILFGEDLLVELVTEFFDVASSSHGRIGRRIKNRYVEIKGVPLMWSDLAKLFPYATLNIGDVIFGATDKPMVITPRNGRPLTIANVMPFALPGISLHTAKPILRGMTWRGLVANASDPSAAASYFSFGSNGTNVAQTGLDLTKIPNTLYSAGYNSATYRAQDGFDIDFSLGLEPEHENELHLNYRVTELEAAAKFAPIGKTEADYATLMGWDGVAIGGSPYAGALVITGAGTGAPIVTLAGMQVQSGGVAYGARPLRTGEVQLASIRSVTSGNLNALWTFAAVE
ncbi:MAG: hypothetical protein C0518_05580 [Opitutus sp.]|nr:hypothetical protein [Opitutus sp.]